MNKMRERLKWLLFPGMNLHARLRRRLLPSYFGTAAQGQERLVLDAGCGNGMLTHQSYLRGNRVIGVSIKEDEVARCRSLFNEFLGIPETSLSFRVANLYELDTLGLQFDEIICSEVIEHIRRDADVCRSFWNVLKPGGVLHLCTPNADHPDNIHQQLDEHEAGGHVRPGYTLASFKSLLEPIGFRITENAGVSGPIRQFFNRRIILLQQSGKSAWSVPLFLAALPLLWLDPRKPRVPFSIYVRAQKPS